MKKLNSVVYNKLVLQAEEAKELGLTKLASGISSSLGDSPEEQTGSYNFDELQGDVYQELWKVVACVIKYHNLESVDAEKVHEALESFANKLIEEVENSLNVDNTQVGPMETKVPGESK
jgi:hypothetical protein